MIENIRLAIISTGRPGNVPFMKKFCAPYKCHWYVNDGERQAYMDAGADIVQECGNNISEARNAALRNAWGNELISCQLSDDIRSIKYIDKNTKPKIIEFDTALTIMHRVLAYGLKKTKIVGVAPTDNALNYTGEDVSDGKLVGFSLFLYAPTGPLFDPAVALKEDYDMNIQHIIDGNAILRCNTLLCNFPHRQNEGGANTYRNDSTEAAATRALMAKWPKYIIPHKTRPGQVSLDYRALEKRKNGIEPTSLF